MKTLVSISSTIVLFGSLIFSSNSFAKASMEKPSLPVEERQIYSISLEPNTLDGGRTYTLEIFTDENETRKVVSIIRPLDGRLIDVATNDVDGDGTNELVVMMVQTTAINAKAHFDVFEFDGKRISWVQDFVATPKLFNLFEKYIKSP